MGANVRAPDLLTVKLFTATSTDALSGTQLVNSPGNGEYHIYIASSVNTATLSITKPGGQAATSDTIALWVNGVPPIDSCLPYVVPVVKGDKVVVSIGGTTGNIYMVVAFYSR